MGDVALVLNPAARGASRARVALEKACAAARLDPPLVLTTTIAEPGGPQARAAVAAGARRVVVAGGDGTVREVAAALAGSEAVLGIIPSGTANLVARGVGVPLGRPDAAAWQAIRGEGRPVDLGSVELHTVDGGLPRLPFLVVVGMGHDAASLAALRRESKARLGWWAYLLPGLRRLRAPGLPVRVRLDDEPEQVERAWSVLAVNVARLPLGARVVPGARADDGLLHLAIVAPRHLRDWAQVARTGWRRSASPTERRAVRYRTASVLTLTLPEPGPVQVDGDVVPDILRVRIELRPGAVRIAGPPAQRLR